MEGPGLHEETRTQLKMFDALGHHQLAQPPGCLEANELYYLVDQRWWSEWRAWGSGAAQARPGSINNTPLLDLGDTDTPELKKALKQDEDFVIVSEKEWAQLQNWYPDSGPVIQRRAVASSNSDHAVALDLYGLRLKVHRSSDLSARPTTIVESKTATIRLFKERACRELGLDSGKVRIWDYFNKKRSHEELDKKLDSTLEACNMFDDNDVLLEQQLEDGTWLNYVSEPSKTANDHGEISRGTPPCTGVVGLQNLGNTCFMNSSIQCLSNVKIFREHFITDAFRDTLNQKAFKTNGKLAEAFAQLLKDMWNPNATQVAPREFKYQIGQFAEQFTGYRQHDSMEFIEYLLDGLKEDLNRVQGSKPFVELKEAEGRPDREVAEEAKNNYLVRNNSYVDELFLGFYKSTVECTHPGCDRVSVKFDPFLSIKVPLTNSDEDRMTTLTVAVVPRRQAIARHKVKVPKNGTAGDIAKAAAQAMGLAAEDCLLVEVYLKKIDKYFEATESIDGIRPNDVLVLYEVDEAARQAAAVAQQTRWTSSSYSSAATEENNTPLGERCGVVIHMRKNRYASSSARDLVGIPLLTSMPRSMSACDMASVVQAELERHIGPLAEGWVLCTTADKGTVEESHLKRLEGDEVVNLESRSLAYLIVEWPGDVTPDPTIRFQEAALGSKGINGGLRDSSDSAVRLEDCIQMFTQTDRLAAADAWYCNKCKEHREATKKMEFWSLPPVLLLQLKRFTYTRYTRDRLDTDVIFPLEGLDMSPYVMPKEPNEPNEPNEPPQIFDLAALSLHGGSLGGGHYVAYGRSSVNGKWYYFNDSFCKEVEPAEVAKEQSGAYVLFYVRRNLRPPSWDAT